MNMKDNYGPPERVHMEFDRFDGPRDGIAEINGKLHRFISVFSEEIDDFTDVYKIFPVSDELYMLEKELWHIFVKWVKRYNKHPGGKDKRWDELKSVLTLERDKIPGDAMEAKAKIVRFERENRYEESGPDYMMRWLIL